MNRDIVRKIWMTRAAGLLCVVAFGTPMMAGCNEQEFQSRWRDREIAVDGMIGTGEGPDEEWAGARVALEDENAVVGLMNDDEYLYISFVARDPMAEMQMMGRGLTVWFDPDGGKDEVLGVQFPLGMQYAGAGGGMMGPGMNKEPGERDREDMRKRLAENIESMDMFIIRGPGEDERHPRDIDEGRGIEVRIGMTDLGLVYELKVPLSRTEEHLYAIGAEPGEVIGVGLKTPDVDREAMSKSMGDRGMGGMGGGRGGRGGGMGGRGGGKGGGMGRGGMGGGRPQMPEPLDVWAKVELAEAGAPLSEEQNGGVAVTSHEW